MKRSQYFGARLVLVNVRNNVHKNMRLTLHADRNRELSESTNKKALFRVKKEIAYC